MTGKTAEHRARRRAIWTFTCVGLAAIAVVVVVAAVITTHGRGTPTSVRSATSPQPPAHARTGWNTTAEDAVAARPMLALPPQDAQPQPLTDMTAGPPISLPRPPALGGRWIPSGFPASSVGALAQLKALDEAAMTGGDPDTYARAYRGQALPGAPDPHATGLFSVLTSFRAAGGLPDVGPVADLSVDYDITEGLIKGVADDGRYTVACVLGELTVQYQLQTVAVGVGDCQALRWTGADWRISPGVLAAPAPCAWPGSVDSVNAGYRELS
jgi:hypothetical protein